MNSRKKLNQIRSRRVGRTRAKIFGKKTRPRLTVFRSNKGMYVQLIDDEAGRTLVAVSSKEVAAKAKTSKTKIAEMIGKTLAEKAVKAGIKRVVFDRRGYAFHGRVKAVAEAARAGGLEF